MEERHSSYDTLMAKETWKETSQARSACLALFSFYFIDVVGGYGSRSAQRLHVL